MIYCKIVKEDESSNKYPAPKDVYRVTNYVLDMNKAVHGVCGSNMLINGVDVLHSDNQFIANQFLYIQADMSGCSRRLYHIILSFDIDTSFRINFSQIKYIAEMIMNLYQGYQSIYVLHENKEHVHLHFLFNNIPVYVNQPKLSKLMNIQKIEELVDSYVSDCIYAIPNRRALRIYNM